MKILLFVILIFTYSFATKYQTFYAVTDSSKYVIVDLSEALLASIKYNTNKGAIKIKEVLDSLLIKKNLYPIFVPTDSNYWIFIKLKKIYEKSSVNPHLNYWQHPYTND